jgi:hypothetical protein
MTLGTGWRRVRLVFLSSVLIGLVAYTGCDIWAGKRVTSELARLESRYGSFADGTASAPEVPAPENRAALIKAAVALANPGTSVDRRALSKFMADPGEKTLPPELRAYLDSNAEAIRMARAFVTRSRSSFGGDYRSLANLPPLLEMRGLANVLNLAAHRAMEAGQTDDAASLVAAGLLMSSACRDEPRLITQLIRIAVADISIDTLQRLSENTELSRTALDALARALAENREPLPMSIGLRGEVNFMHLAFLRLEAGRSDDLSLTAFPLPLLGPAARLMRPFARWGHARYLGDAGRLLDNQTGPRPRPSLQNDEQPPKWAFIARSSHSFTTGLQRAMSSGDDFASELAAAELVIALRRHRLDRGAYPEDLSAVAPVYLPDVPIDPRTGKPPIYSRDGQGFTLTMAPSEFNAPTKRPTAVWKVAG